MSYRRGNSLTLGYRNEDVDPVAASHELQREGRDSNKPPRRYGSLRDTHWPKILQRQLYLGLNWYVVDRIIVAGLLSLCLCSEIDPLAYHFRPTLALC